MLAFADARLDIAWSSLKHGRDFVTGHPDPALGLPELLRGGVTLACATLFTGEHEEDETHREVGERQLAYYEALPGRSAKRLQEMMAQRVVRLESATSPVRRRPSIRRAPW